MVISTASAIFGRVPTRPRRLWKVIETAKGQAMDLCRLCQGFSLHELARLPGRTGNLDLTIARQNVAEGCRFCSLLVTSVCKGQLHPESERQMRIYIQAISEPDTGNGGHQRDGDLLINGLRVFLAPATYLADGLEPVAGSQATLNVCADPESDAGTSGAVSGRYVGHDPQSTTFAREVRHWLDACSRGHERCRRSLSGGELPDARRSPLPTRCVDVGSLGDGDALRLADTAGQTGAYATLSHRWGADTALSQTTTLNRAARADGFSASGLPKTFRDAVDVARRLGVRHLWIDSLCIIQGEGGSDDWAREAGRMAGYYQGSLVTLAAAAEGGGLFEPGRTSSRQFGRRLVRLPFRDRVGTPRGEFYVFPAEPVAPRFEAEVRDSALMSRGWVFQEWMLSRRIVYFAELGVYLECQSGQPRNSYGERLAWPAGRAASGEFVLKALVDFSTAGQEHGRLWWDLVETYSALELSFPAKDRLLALSGVLAEFSLARRAQLATPGHDLYASGLWLSNLHQSLLWQQKHRPLPGAIARVRNMPSWSWASFHGPVTWKILRGSQEVSNLCEVLEIGDKSSTVGPDVVRTHAEADAAITRIRLRCRALAVTAWEEYIPHELDRLPVPISYATTDGVGLRKVSLAPPASGGGTILSTRHLCGWASFEDAGFQNQRDFADGGETLALHMLSSRALDGPIDRGLFFRWQPAHCVVLVRRVEGGEGRLTEYRRIGMGAL
ncbi:hypothetical protein RB594_004077 [Gaeumannomyces avenae]